MLALLPVLRRAMLHSEEYILECVWVRQRSVDSDTSRTDQHLPLSLQQPHLAPASVRKLLCVKP